MSVGRVPPLGEGQSPLPQKIFEVLPPILGVPQRQSPTCPPLQGVGGPQKAPKPPQKKGEDPIFEGGGPWVGQGLTPPSPNLGFYSIFDLFYPQKKVLLGGGICRGTPKLRGRGGCPRPTPPHRKCYHWGEKGRIWGGINAK